LTLRENKYTQVCSKHIRVGIHNFLGEILITIQGIQPYW